MPALRAGITMALASPVAFGAGTAATVPAHATGGSSVTYSVGAQQAGGLPTNFRWSDQGTVLAPRSDATHRLVSVKDPTIVRYNEWLVYATTANTSHAWSLVHTHFSDFSQANTAPQYYLDRNPNIGSGYRAASNVTFTSMPWTNDISHGGMIRAGNDQLMEISPCRMRYLYQGRDPQSSGDYSPLPYRLGLLTRTNSTC